MEYTKYVIVLLTGSISTKRLYIYGLYTLIPTNSANSFIFISSFLDLQWACSNIERRSGFTKL